jgi:hypothetical protein
VPNKRHQQPQNRQGPVYFICELHCY